MMLKERLQKEVYPKLATDLKVGNVFALPRIKKITVNVGVSAGKDDKGYIDAIEENVVAITGQKPVRTKARIAVSGFGIRQGQVVGLKVTLRGRRMFDFLEKLVAIDLPRIRDFRGIPESSVDGQGNLSIGIKEHIIFPEIDQNKTDRPHGLEVTVTTTGSDHATGLAFFRALGVPFADPSNK